ncbi:hypothetical protein BOX15_Mlig033749g3 [Macrostomum lignano]|uniref:Maelstrom domain-containing protein n=2 Tax=Macrostomum lignano TaxID=282301 RepID=A0A267DPG2_9PLAT|nr:hypothetical protein BOX15_Mlig033749g3 [Macrostomum lignano]
MPLPPNVQLGDDGKPKRRRVTAITMFTRDLRGRRADLRNLPMSNMQLINAATEAFDRLSLEEQRRYEKLAKAENRRYDDMYGDQFRRDSEGAYISERDSLAAKKHEFERYTAKIVSSLAGHVTDKSELIRSEFVVGDVCPFVDADERDNNLYVPAEFGFVKFSLARGVVGSVHCIVQPRPGAIPTHLQSHCRDLLTDTHGIPTHSCPEAEESMARLCIELKALCLNSAEAQQQYQLPIFVPSQRLVAMQKSLIYAFNNPVVSRDGCPFVKEISCSNKTKVFSFESLFLAILGSNCLPEEKRMNRVLDQQITQLLDRHRYTGEEHACKRHRQEDNMTHCALMRAHCHAWTLLERAIEPFELTCTPNHGPKELDTPVARPVKAGWLSKANNRRLASSSCPANMAASSGGAGSGGGFRGQRCWQPPAQPPAARRLPAAAAAAAPTPPAVNFFEPGCQDDRYADEVDEDCVSQAPSDYCPAALEHEFTRAVSMESRLPVAARQDSGFVDTVTVGGVGGAGGRGRGRGRPKASGPRAPIIID